MAGFSVDHRGDAQLFQFLRTLPETSLLAGWPGSYQPIDSAPYIARRQAFITFETHQAFHREYALTMRQRMRALIDAMLSTDTAPLLRLRDDWGVTHLIIDRRHFEARPPSYFKPFDRSIQEAVGRGQALGFELPRQWERAAVFSWEHVVIVALDRLDCAAERSGFAVPGTSSAGLRAVEGQLAAANSSTRHCAPEGGNP
jgi:hypothetical protein